MKTYMNLASAEASSSQAHHHSKKNLHSPSSIARQAQKLRKKAKKLLKEKERSTGGRKAPPKYNKERGNKLKALAIASDCTLGDKALRNFTRDMKSAGDTSQYNMTTWIDLHAWWSHDGSGIVPPVLPLFGAVPHELRDTPSAHWEDICHRCLYTLRAQLKTAVGVGSRCL